MKRALIALMALCASEILALPTFADGAGSSQQPGQRPLPQPIAYLPEAHFIDLCLRSTGTHLKVADNECIPANGYSISREALLVHGAGTLGQAFRGW
jgi:hypothetical protein